MKKLIALVLLLGCGAVQAATVEAILSESGSQYVAQGVSGLDVNGITYNVSFVDGAFADFNLESAFPLYGDQTGSDAAATAIRAALNEDARNVHYVGQDPSTTSTRFFLPWKTEPWSPPGEVALFTEGGVLDTVDQWAFIRSGIPIEANVTFAVLSQVPIPAAAYLFASGLGLLGWLRRRQTA
jgi:hypothetical protein